MKIGYPCINRSIGCSSNKKFRLANFTKEKFNETVRNNLNCLDKIVDYNVENNMLRMKFVLLIGKRYSKTNFTILE